MLKETKETYLKMRVTTKEKERVKEYAEAHNMTVSELMRMALDRIMYANS
jgi:antitoxin component of RelBE/YafQ-DinJ toxin-antitoxin module